MDTISMAAAAVTGARHLRTSRNGQDAVASYRNVATGVAVVVVADGCGSGSSSEVGAGLGARLFARTLAAELEATAGVGVGREREIGAGGEATTDVARGAIEPDVRGGLASFDWAARFAAARATVAATLAAIARPDELSECFLFTLVAAFGSPHGAGVWALGDGVYSFGDRTRVLGPFADNQPPYLAYDVVGEPCAAHLELAPDGCDTIVIATDGACDLPGGIERFATTRNLTHPDALRRELALLARGEERIDWDQRRVVRTPAVLQDDCAVGVLRWRSRS